MSPPTGVAARPPPSRRPHIQWSLPTFLSPHPISHAIPLAVFRDLNYECWNCNVFRLYWNFSESNCMRVFWGAGAWVPAGGVAGSREPSVRLSETGVAFACSCPCGVETAIAFARAGRASTETAIAFAGDKWVFLACFSVAEVLSVSAVAVQG